MVQKSTGEVALGPTDLKVRLGDHLCIFYRGSQQRDEILLPYLREGLLAGDKCLCVVDASDPEQLFDEFEDDVAGITGNPLEVMSSGQAYLPDGRFATDRMVAFWDEAMTAALDDGYGLVRAAGEMSWALRDVPGAEQLIPYEAALNRHLREYPQVILCFYDLELFKNGQLLLDIMRTHPKVLLSGSVIDNPWYAEPDPFEPALA